MRYRSIITFLSIFLFLSLHRTKAVELRPIELNDEGKVYLIGTAAQIYEDESNELTISEVSKSTFDQKFEPIGTNYPNLGVSSSTYWVKFRLKPSVNFRAFLFNIGYLFHDRLEMYRVNHGVTEQIFFSDIDMGTISHNHHKRDRFAVPIELKDNEIYDYYLAIRDNEGITMFLELSSEENFLKRQANDSLRVGFISGIFLLASVFAFVIYVRDKQPTYLFFFLLNFFFITTLLCHNGNLQILVWPGNLKLNHDFFIFSGFITNSLSFIFTTYFLELKERMPKWYLFGLFVTFVMLIGALSPLLGLDNRLWIFYFTLIAGSIFELVVSFLSLKQGFKLAKPFFISRVLFSLVILSFALMRLGLIPYPGPRYDVIGELGVCFQVSLLAFVITDYKHKLEIVKLEKEKDRERLRNEELYHANKVKTEFLGMASHDLKGPLRNISSLASFIENKQVTSEDEINQMSTMIRQSSEKLSNLVKDLLDNTALEMGKLELKIEEIDMLKFIQSIVDQYELEAKRKRQTIHLIVNLEKKLKVEIDEIRFSQVIENLLSNAIKFSPYDKNIWVIVSKPENSNLLIEIKDEGPGFTEEDKKYLFNYYKKLSAKPTGKESSSGLGLSIVKKIVLLHNGKIWLESEQGKGASFFVEL